MESLHHLFTLGIKLVLFFNSIIYHIRITIFNLSFALFPGLDYYFPILAGFTPVYKTNSGGSRI